MRRLSAFLYLTLAVAVVTLLPSHSALAAGSKTVQRGSSVTLNWNVQNAPFCQTRTSPIAADSFNTSWAGQSKAGSGSETFTPTVPGSYLFSCEYFSPSTGVQTSDGATLVVTDCSAGQTWNGSACVSSSIASCKPFGIEISGSGGTMPYYTQSTAVWPNTCTNGTFTCNNGVLSPYDKTIPYSQTCTQVCPTGTSWNGTSCVSGPPPTCPAGQTWNGTTCVSVTPPTPVDGTCGTPLHVTANACTTGTLGANAVQPDGTYHWYCNGSNGGSNSPLCWSCADDKTWNGTSCVTKPPAVCTDPTATNYNKPEPCTYGTRVPTAWISATPSSVTSGARSQLRWGSTDATSCTAGGPWSNSGQLSGSGLTDPLTADTTFTITCSNATASSPTASATVTVTGSNPPGCAVTPPANAIDPTFCCLPPSYWNSQGYCVNDSISGPTPVVTAAISIPVTRNGYSYEYSNQVQHISYGANIDALTMSSLYTTTDYGGMTNCKEYVAYGDGPTANWQYVQTLYPGMWGVSLNEGPTGPYNQTTKWKFDCENGWGKGSGETDLIVCPADRPTWQPVVPASMFGSFDPNVGTCVNNNPVPTASISSNPATIVSGSSSTLSWTSSNATSCTALGGFSTSDRASGTAVVSPTVTTSYGVTCSGANGTSAPAYTTVTVVQPTATISAAPVRVQSGKTSMISWASTDVTSCAVSGPSLSSSAKTGSAPVVVTGQATYTITCQTAAGTPVTQSVTVNITPIFNEF